MDELSLLAQKYKADKWGKHHYTPVYYELMKDKRNEVKSVFEIGTAEGASMFMWRDFFPQATIHGGDNVPSRVELFKNEERMKAYLMDQSKLADIYNVLPILMTADLIVDDGSHRGADQLFTFLAIAPYMKSGAVYVIEDVADTDIIPFITDSYYIEVKEVSKTRYDDRLIIFKK